MKVKKVTELDRKTVDEYKVADKVPLVVVLDNVRSLNNVGSVFRTSDAFLIDKIILCGITATPPHADIHKTALGAEDSVDWIYSETTLQAVRGLKQDGYTVYSLELAHNSVELGDVELNKEGKYALILGNEVKGVSQDVVDICDHCVEIAQYGTKHSLNVSVSGGIAIWRFAELLR